ncbi:MAG: UbiA family prenyltransferase [Archaeoglobaceae archaeon]|nr:UbiA family prenyltransferase [Archaeoglobaceae archaeon]MDW8014291.1 UbiA family prenyltransferase [Archaeoglobaceae archaeon]
MLVVNFLIKPFNISFPIPIVPFFISLFNDLSKFLLLYIYAAFLTMASNLWNHLNDAEEDLKFGSRDPKILLENKKFFIGLATLLYIVTLSFTSFTVLAAVPAIFTWFYSDKIFLYKFTNFRLKEHYVTELLTYCIVVPTAFLAMWSMCSEINFKAIYFAFMFTTVALASVVLKDIKDMTQDSTMGYKTLAVVFDYKFLLKLSIFLSYIFYIIIFIYSFSFNILYVVSVIPLFVLIKTNLNLTKEKWTIKSEKIVNEYMYSSLLALCLLCLAATIEYLQRSL